MQRLYLSLQNWNDASALDLTDLECAVKANELKIYIIYMGDNIGNNLTPGSFFFLKNQRDCTVTGLLNVFIDN